MRKQGAIRNREVYMVSTKSVLSHVYQVTKKSDDVSGYTMCESKLTRYFVENYVCKRLYEGHSVFLVIKHQDGMTSTMQLGMPDSHMIDYRGKQMTIEQCKDDTVQCWQDRIMRKLNDPYFKKRMTDGIE